MKIQTFLSIVVVLLLYACSTTQSIPPLTPSSSEIEQRASAIQSNWTELQDLADLTYDNISSWVPESGIRGRYEIAKKYLAKSIVERIVGMPAFIKGPHESEINFRSLKTFGYYNPRFLSKLQEQLNSVLVREAIVKNLQPMYDKELKQYLRVYYLSYKVAANKQGYIDGYLSAIDNTPDPTNPNDHIFLSEPSSYLQESFRGFAESLEGEGYDVFEAFTCPGFWVRRSIDGTADEFYDLLILTMQAFDPSFVKG